MVVTASDRFINTVAQCFDENMVFDRSRLDPPTSPLVENELTQRTQDCSRIVLDQITGQHPNIENQDRIAPLPEDIKILMIEHAATVSDWLDLTGMFETAKSDPELEARIEMCSKLKLEQWLEQANQRIELLFQDLREKRTKYLRFGDPAHPLRDADAEEKRNGIGKLFNKSQHALKLWQETRAMLQEAILRSGSQEAKAQLIASMTTENEEITAAHEQTSKTLQSLRDLPVASRDAEKLLSAEVEDLLIELRFQDIGKNRIPFLQRWVSQQQPRASAKNEVLKHILHVAFNAPFSPLTQRNAQRDRIIAQLEPYKPALEAKLSQRQRLSLRLSEISASVFHHQSFQMACFGLCTIGLYRVLVATGNILIPLAENLISATTAAALTSFLPPIALKVVSAAAPLFAWMWANQILSLACLLGINTLADMIRIPLGLRSIIIAPILLTVLLPITISVFVLSLAAQVPLSLTFLGESLQKYNATRREARDKLEEQQGLKLWLQMANDAAEQRRAAQQ